jgi:uncharacterized membrane protein YbhN (UPF0104 family)
VSEELIEKSPERIPGWVKRVVPILVSILILYYYFREDDLSGLKQAFENANLWIAIPAILIPLIASWFMRTLIVERHFKWFHGPFPFWSYFWVHGAINILMFINTLLGGGGLLLYQQRKANITWRKLGGILLFRVGVGTGWGMMFVMIPLTLAMQYYGYAEKAELNLYVWWFILLVPGLLFFCSNLGFWFRGFDSTGLGKVLVRDREGEFWTAFREASFRQWLLTMLMIVPPIMLHIVGLYFLSLAFGVKVPFLQFMVVGPLAALIMDLPIASAGLGSTTAAWMIFFSEYGTEESIKVLTLFIPVSRSLARALIGLVSLWPGMREISSMGLSED